MGLLTMILGGSAALQIADIAIDASLDETHLSEVDITDNPVEEGSDITDHIQPKPRKLSVQGIHSDTPMVFLSGIFSASNRSKSAYEGLVDLQKSRETFDVTTGLTTYENMVLESLSVPRDATLGGAFKFTANFREIRIVQSQLTGISTALFSSKSLGKVTAAAASGGAKTQGSILEGFFKAGLGK